MNNIQFTPYSRLGLGIILGLSLTLIAISTIHAQKPGDLDPTFKDTGIVTTTIGGWAERGLGVAIQPDDKIVVVGEYGHNDGLGFAVLRYTVTGTLDSTFNVTNSGFITTPIADYDNPFSVVIQPDGKIVVAGFSGTSYDTYYDDVFAVARYTVTGTLDTTFNDTGIVTTPISNDTPYGNTDRAYSVALQPQGEIVLAGHTSRIGQDGSSDFAVVRYTPTGTLDSTFNQTGIVTTPIGSGDDIGAAVAIQPDGKIVVVGSSENDIDDTSFAFVRYTPTGTLDSTFNQTGIVTTPIDGGEDMPYSVAIQPEGKIVAAGYSEKDNSDRYNFAVVRYTITGALDTTFNHTGIVTTSFSPDQRGYRMAIQPDGKILVVGYGGNGTGEDAFAVVRYTTSGALDTTFNTTGIVTTPIGSVQDDGATDVAIQSDGRIVVAGIDVEDTGGNFDTNFAVVRYLNHWHTIMFMPIMFKE